MADNLLPNYNPADTQDLGGLLHVFKQNLFRDLRVCLPGIVEDFDRSVNRVTVSPAITLQTTTGECLKLPSIAEVPVCTVGGGGFMASFPLQKGDTGWLIFADKDISLFKDSETISPANTLRKHNLADAVFIPDIMGKATVAQGDGAVWQKLDGSVKAVLNESGIDITGNVSIDGDLSVSGEISATGTITSDTDVIGGGISLKTHVHGGVESGSSTTGVAQ